MFDCNGELARNLPQDQLNIGGQKADNVGAEGAAGDSRLKTPNPWSDIKYMGRSLSPTKSFLKQLHLARLSSSVVVSITPLDVSSTVLRMLPITVNVPFIRFYSLLKLRTMAVLRTLWPSSLSTWHLSVSPDCKETIGMQLSTGSHPMDMFSSLSRSQTMELCCAARGMTF